jgi:3-oxoacyl-[acyl-carrier protein] reductase
MVPIYRSTLRISSQEMPGTSPTTDSSTTNELCGKVAVVTGSSGGIGRAIARELAVAGADVIVHGQSNRSGAEQAAAEIRAVGRNALILMADIANESQHESLVEQAWQWRDGVDIWINNAGVDVLTGENASLSFDEKLALLWQIDVASTIRLSRFVGARMKQHVQTSGEAVILNIGWDQAEQGMAGDSGEMFAATKGAIMAFSKSLAQSLAPAVRVNCLAPGWIKTRWGDGASKYWQERACREALLARWGTPEDIARVARFMVSPAANFITGQVVPVNGGFRRAD